MPTSIANLWIPEIWVEGMKERQATFPTILNSGIMSKSPVFDEIASGAGVAASMPGFKDITDQDDEIQIEDTAPSDQVITGLVQVTPILNRVTKNSTTALAGQVALGDSDAVIAAIVDQLIARRDKQRQKTLISILRGNFGTGTQVLSAAAELSGNRVVAADETGADAIASQVFNPTLFIQGKALLGELEGELAAGALLVHPNVLASIEIADAELFKDGVPSGLPFTVRTYRGIPIFTSAALVRAGTGNGFVYDSYLFAKGVVGFGEKPQIAGTVTEPVIDVAALSYFPDPDKNNQRIYDRTRFVMHLNGTKWVGTPAGQSATNAELATVANWDYSYSTTNRTGIIAFQTNG